MGYLSCEKHELSRFSKTTFLSMFRLQSPHLMERYASNISITRKNQKIWSIRIIRQYYQSLLEFYKSWIQNQQIVKLFRNITIPVGWCSNWPRHSVASPWLEEKWPGSVASQLELTRWWRFWKTLIRVGQIIDLLYVHNRSLWEDNGQYWKGRRRRKGVQIPVEQQLETWFR